jgi:hypothetical protein
MKLSGFLVAAIIDIDSANVALVESEPDAIDPPFVVSL